MGPMIYQYNDYRSFLRYSLIEKQKSNSAFSLRAFSKKLGLSQSTVSQIFAGRRNLSIKAALQVARKLALKEKETDYLCLLVQLESSRDFEHKSLLLKKIKSLNPKFKSHLLDLDQFKVIADWYHLPILSLTEIPAFKLEPKYIGQALGISALEAHAALERLDRLGLIVKKEGRLEKTHEHFVAESSKKNNSLRLFHKQMLEKAIEALGTQSPLEKVVGSETLAISKAKIPEVRMLIEDCFQKIVAVAQEDQKKTDVYHLGIQFFNLTKKTEGP